ncbi:dTDP-4-dehydrorhamnose reductase [Candidatus Falkowbacteria bacterium RIFOXYB2_FULL_38_15]|uniref:dTDP-4-dehydrorhamnose reductase n=1 Tax=Candidatus Falkowbacteria bacterium RIFOXYA2_FULL_38_12 TaxID=1797993 RepID=A0A1F5S3A7_9BACT|nr:MAG: dTDP-4-dehydrorhamnose reductase [Candidatus Falkowbacteria bacterium RIFOXYA2_FULL_38_12]OGF32968.1 MAG: dTDP-4-dehydrorhamnose reductase [Candidatus Falkowbacteria bacterium RIFOXYB2_FULL_38_15]OGF42634.1 MAG: dTDP-4-dehydrorhamnose reductase [Candidatus Falkowbacteria bacterium RIFOXYD2_FULL_39_16]
MKILITGSSGMLGQELAREFRENNYEVLAWDKDELDITDREMVLNKIKKIKPEIIINSAAYNAVDKIEESEEDKKIANKINGLAVGYLAEVAKDIEAIFVHYSTDYVFGGRKVGGYKETDKPNPQSEYAKSKLLGEEELLKQQGLRFYLIRTSRLFGKPAVSEGAKKSFVDVMLQLAETKDNLDLIDEELSSPTYVCDLARRTREIIEEKKSYGIYHITNFGACTWYGWAKEIFKIVGKNIKLTPVSGDKFPRPAKRPRYSVLLNTKLPEIRKWEEALGEYLRTK